VSSSLEIRTLTTPQELFAAAAEEVVRAGTEAVTQRGRFTIALSGGSTPKSLFHLLATNARTVLPWDRMFFFWGDERHVPPTDPDSNYKMAEETMLSKIPVAAGNVFRIAAENPDAAAAAEAYEKTLQKFFCARAGTVPALRSNPTRHGTRWSHGFAVSRRSRDSRNPAHGRRRRG